jgi:hypothetical protein
MKMGYGTIEEGDLTDHSYVSARGEDDPSENFFDADQTYYLKETMSPQQRWRKCMLATFPILVAVLIVGGLGFLLFRDFGHLYPGRNGDPKYHDGTSKVTRHHATGAKDDYANHDYIDPVDDDSAAHNSAPRKHSTSNGEAACSAHVECSTLLGDCCPTLKGVTLECCHN